MLSPKKIQKEERKTKSSKTSEGINGIKEKPIANNNQKGKKWNRGTWNISPSWAKLKHCGEALKTDILEKFRENIFSKGEEHQIVAQVRAGRVGNTGQSALKSPRSYRLGRIFWFGFERKMPKQGDFTTTTSKSMVTLQRRKRRTWQEVTKYLSDIF